MLTKKKPQGGGGGGGKGPRGPTVAQKLDAETENLKRK